MSARLAVSLALAGLCALMGSPAQGRLPTAPPPDLTARVGFAPRPGAQLPLDLAFHDAQGASVHLGEALAGKPALLVPGYYSCTNLCAVVRAGVAQAVTATGLVPGEQFNIVLFSIDPHESPADAAAAQRSDAIAHPFAKVARWRYLIGSPAASSVLARGLGFRYLFDPHNGQYAHAAGIVVLSPRGIITQYLPGVQFSPLTLRLAMVSASQGRIGTLVDRLVLLCCDYDSSTGRYSLLITRVLQALGILTLAALGGLIVALRRAEARRDAAGEKV